MMTRVDVVTCDDVSRVVPTCVTRPECGMAYDDLHKVRPVSGDPLDDDGRSMCEQRIGVIFAV